MKNLSFTSWAKFEYLYEICDVHRLKQTQLHLIKLNDIIKIKMIKRRT